MSPIWKSLLLRTTLREKIKEQGGKNSFSDYEFAKAHRELRRSVRYGLRDFFLIVLGIFSAAFGFKGFLLTNHFIDGGATGISLLVSLLSDLPLSLLIVCVNMPFIILAYHVVNKRFAIKTALAIIGLSACLALVTFPNVTNDNLLVAVFGGFFLGAGIGMAVRGGAVIDGTEVLAIFLSRKLGTTIGDIIIIINVIIFSAAAYFLGIEVALYSMITYLSASKTLDFIIEGIEEYTGVTIVSTRSKAIREMILEKMGRGVTVYGGGTGYGRRGEINDIDVVYTVVTRLELSRMNVEIVKIDPNAFVVMHSVKDTKGGMIKKRPLKH